MGLLPFIYDHKERHRRRHQHFQTGIKIIQFWCADMKVEFSTKSKGATWHFENKSYKVILNTFTGRLSSYEKMNMWVRTSYKVYDVFQLLHVLKNVFYTPAKFTLE